MPIENSVELSDEDFLNAFEGAQAKQEAALNSEESDEPEVVDEPTDDVEEIDDSEASDEPEEELTDELDEDEPESEDEGTDDSENDSEELESEDEDTDETDEVEVPEEYRESVELAKQILAPFKANGRMMEVKTADEAVTLMKMGANYVKKMEILKPRLNAIRKLDDNGIMEDGVLNQLIDISKGDKVALAAFLKSKNIDPITLVDEDAEGYKPNTYSVDEVQVELEESLSEIKEDSPEIYKNLRDNVIKGWDDKSRSAISNNPKLLRALAENMSIQIPNEGINVFDKVNAEVERQKALGKLNGMSSIEAYFAIGQAMFENQSDESEVPPKQLPPNGKKAKNDQDTSARKKRVSVNKGSKSTARKQVEQDKLNTKDDDEFSAYMDKMLGG